MPVAIVAALLLARLLAAPAAARGETWSLVGTEQPPIEWDYPDGRFTRGGTSAHFIRDLGVDHVDIAFAWSEPPATVTAGETYTLHLTADLAAGHDCRPPYIAARFSLAERPCAFCADGREVGAGICNQHNAADPTFSIPPGNFREPEARLHVVTTDGSLFSATIVTYVYARADTVPTATATVASPPTTTPARTATRTANPSPTPSAPASDAIACGETRNGTLSDADPDLFGDGTFADIYFFTLTQTTEVRFSLTGTGFDPFIWVADPSNPNDWVPIVQGGSPQEVILPAGRYVVVANNTYPIAPGAYPYALRMTCDGDATPTRTATRTPSRSPTAGATATLPAPPTRTASLTATATPTATASQTATATPAVDLVADHLEVVQTIQDLRNRIPLIADKRTFVRFHARADAGVHHTRAFLRVLAGGGNGGALLSPLNPNAIVRPLPVRINQDESFLFELPTRFTRGTITLEGELNPHDQPRERARANNTLRTTVTFEERAPIHLVLYRVSYLLNGATQIAGEAHADALLDWLERVYPIPSLSVDLRTYHHATGVPWCETVNAVLRVKRYWDDLTGDIPPRTRYYGMVSDGGGKAGFMRGCAAGIPSFAASGPTGTGQWGWDTDGSYGDWYGGHEIGHSWGQAHTGWCDDINPFSRYPYPNARISAALDGNAAVFGFDAGTRAIYEPTWTDLMSYCRRQWISDYNYRNLLDAIELNILDLLEGRTAATAARGPQWVVTGGLDLDSGRVELAPLFVVPDAALDTAPAGDHAVVLRSGRGAELGRHPFAVAAVDEGPPHPDDPDPQPRRLGHFSVLVPYVEDTARIDIEGPGGVLHTVRAGLATPAVELLSPNGGEVLDGETIPLAWIASDADGDPLTFNLQYSADDGATWELVAQNLTGDRAALDAENVRASDAGRFRIWVSDGLHSGSDESDGPFTVPNAGPTVEIVAPADGVTVAAGQTLALVARARDLDAGILDGAQLEWRSDRDGLLGQGRKLAIAELGVGRHTITVRADDGDGGTASAAVRVVVVADLSELPTGCPGDCSGDGRVTVDELVAGVGIALGSRALAACATFDGDDDGSVTVAELIAAVNAALGGCDGAAPRPTPTAVPAGDCCAAHGGTGCATASCQQCVCGQVPECCTSPWDDLCVAVAQGCYPDCDCPIILQP